MGWRLAPTTELCFTDLRVLRRNLLSRKSHAFYQSMDLQDRFTVQMSSSVVGMAEGTLKMAFHYAKTREAFDRDRRI
jgi:alkylation response protein AidB-like acyl-CoA dehydrogenase